jgi:hypothetical protein
VSSKCETKSVQVLLAHIVSLRCESKNVQVLVSIL